MLDDASWSVTIKRTHRQHKANKVIHHRTAAIDIYGKALSKTEMTNVAVGTLSIII